MNPISIAVSIVIVAVFVFAVWGSYRSMRSESCCGGGKNCCCARTGHCSILKSEE